MDDAMAGLIAVLIGLGLVGVMLLPVWIIRRRQGRKVFEPVYKDIERLKAERRPALDRAAARLSGMPTCPRCGSTAITVSKRGYKLGRGLFWGLALAFVGFWLFVIPGALVGLAVGLTTGSIGSQTVLATCISCGCRYNPAVIRFADKAGAWK